MKVTNRTIYRFWFMFQGKHKIVDIPLTDREALGALRVVEATNRKKTDLFDLTIRTAPPLAKHGSNGKAE
jgi:hypothetical protein